MGMIINSQELSAGHHEEAMTGARDEIEEIDPTVVAVAPSPRASPDTSVTELASTPNTMTRDRSESLSLFLSPSPSDFSERPRRNNSVLSDDSGFVSAPLEPPPDQGSATGGQAPPPPSIQDDRPEDDFIDVMRQIKARERSHMSDESS